MHGIAATGMVVVIDMAIVWPTSWRLTPSLWSYWDVGTFRRRGLGVGHGDAPWKGTLGLFFSPSTT